MKIEITIEEFFGDELAKDIVSYLRKNKLKE